MCRSKCYYALLHSGSERVKGRWMMFIFLVFSNYCFLVSPPSPHHLTKLHICLLSLLRIPHLQRCMLALWRKAPVFSLSTNSRRGTDKQAIIRSLAWTRAQRSELWFHFRLYWQLQMPRPVPSTHSRPPRNTNLNLKQI